MRDLATPLSFRPVYQHLVWGGQRLARWRADLPPGPIGESWELADHERGMSVVVDGPHAGLTLRELTKRYGKALVGSHFSGGDFPLMVKLIDAHQPLSVQVHPDDRLAKELGVGERGKTECWLMLADGGELFVGTRPGCDRERFATALAAGQVAGELQPFHGRNGEAFFLPARTVHALGAGCLVCEIQQTCDVTFRVDDWGRVGLDGQPRALHVAESLATIDFSRPFPGAVEAPTLPHPAGGTVRRLVSCAYFQVEERRAATTASGTSERCSVIVCLDGRGTLTTAGGGIGISAMQTCLVPAMAGAWQAVADSGTLRLLVATPGG